MDFSVGIYYHSGKFIAGLRWFMCLARAVEP